MKLLKLLSFFAFLGLIFMSCAPLKPYERVFVDDPEMQMSITSCKNFEHYIQSIREGAVSVGGTKGNGGCGCN